MPKRESVTIEHPVVGTLKLDEEGIWNGLVHLPVFAGYDDKSYGDSGGEHARLTRSQKRAAEQFAAGLFQLVVFGEEGQPPTTAQEKAFRFLVEHESQVVDAIMAYVVRAYAGRRDYWTLDGLQQDDAEVDLNGPDDLKQLMRLATVSIDLADDDVADVIFYFNSTLDEEHGVEVTTNRTEIADDVPDSSSFDLPAGLDAAEIEPEPAGHRFVEFKHRGKWRGIYVLNEGLQCVGMVASSYTPHGVRYLVNSPDQIEDVRGATPWQRWFATPARKSAVGWLATSNWLVSLPCLLVAWAYIPQLFWVSLVLSVLCFAGIWFLGEGRLLPSVQIVASITGLVYASNSPDFGGHEHVAEVMGVYGSIVWWCVAAIDTLASLVLAAMVVGLNRDLIREGLGAVLPALLTVVPLTSGLVASHYGYWSSFHLLWLTPLVIAASFALLFTGLFTGIFDFSTRCPECGEPLRTRNAKQCFECDADWH